MPRQLCKSTIRLLESGVEYLAICIESINKPLRIPMHDLMSYYSVPTGLLGISIELISSSILVQTYGEKALLQPSGYYKTAGMIIDELKKLLKNPIPKTNFLVQGIDDKTGHYGALETKLSELQFMMKLRASAVHSARAPSKDVLLQYVNKTIDFLSLLATSKKIASYLAYIPPMHEEIKSFNVLVEDLLNKINKPKDNDGLAADLVSLFLVLPEIPEFEPEWISTIERVSIAPKEYDLAFLLSVLGKCKSINLVKNASSINSIPVSIQPGNPDAIPIDPHYIRREFTKEKDRFYADIGNANGRLTENHLDLPPIEIVLLAFSNGIEQIDEKYLTANLTPHESWPFIAASLARPGTAGPYWYFIRKTDDKEQLDAFVKKARKLGNGYFRNEQRQKEYDIGMQAILKNQPIDLTTKAFKNIQGYINDLEREREKFESKIKLSIQYSELVKKYSKLLYEIANDNEKASTGINALMEDDEEYYDRIAWIRYLLDICDDQDDSQIFLKLSMDDKYKVLSTNIRKSFRMLDFLFYGPNTSWDMNGELGKQ
jgi:hypothetical protein